MNTVKFSSSVIINMFALLSQNPGGRKINPVWFLVLLAAFVVAGCGGGDSPPPGPAPSPPDPAPTDKQITIGFTGGTTCRGLTVTRSHLVNSGDHWICTGSGSAKDRIVFSGNGDLELGVIPRGDGGAFSPDEYCGVIGQVTHAHIKAKECSQVVADFDSWELGDDCSLRFISDRFIVETETTDLTNQSLIFDLGDPGTATCEKQPDS